MAVFTSFSAKQIGSVDIGALVARPEHDSYGLAIVLGKSQDNVMIGVLKFGSGTSLPYLDHEALNQVCLVYPFTWIVDPQFSLESKPDYGGDLRNTAGTLILDGDTYLMRFNARAGVGRSGGTFDLNNFQKVNEPTRDAIPMSGWKIWPSKEDRNKGEPIYEQPPRSK